MANFAYGGSASLADEYSYGYEDDVLQRSADDDQELDAMVQRNIQDVLQRVGSAGEQEQDDTGDAGPAASYGLDRHDSPDLGFGLAPHQQHHERPGPAHDDLSADYGALDGAAQPKSGATASSRAPNRTQPNRTTAHPSQPHQHQQQQPRPGARRPPGGPPAPGAPSQRAAAGAGGAAGRRASLDPAGRRPSDAPAQAQAQAALGGGAEGAAASGAGPSSSMLDVPGQPEASLRLHKARIRALEEDLGRANRALLDREKQLGEALRELKELRTQAAGWARDKKALEGQLDRAKRQAADAETAARSVEAQARDLAKSDSRAERDRKAAEAEVRARDVRLQRALEEVERYKQLLNEVRAQEREAKGSAAQDSGRLLAENRRLERQRSELITAFKKQLKLIEVLKRQKVHLEAARALQFSEEEFLKTLEMGAT